MSFESELRAQLNESEMHRHELMERLQDRIAEIAALQSERDALKEAIKTALTRGTFDFQKFEALISTPASGEPARKP